MSVGASGKERTITNVAAGRVSATSTDAVNGSELYATNQQVTTNTTNIATNTTNLANLGNSAASVLGGNASYNAATGQLTDSNIGGTGQNTVNGAIASVNTAVSALTGQQTHYYSVNDGGTQGANYNNNGATAANALAAGVGAAATATGATAVGAGASAATQNSVAVGNSASVQGPSSGPVTIWGVAIGSNSVSGLSGAGTQGNGVAIGGYANATTTGVSSPVAIGWSANASGSGSQIAIGDWALASGTNSVAIGGHPYSTATQATGNYALAIGPSATATADNTVSLGSGSVASGLDAVAIGGNATAGAAASAQDAIAIGGQTQVAKQGGVAIGVGAQVNNANSVALGANAVTAAANPTTGATINGTAYTFAGGAPIGVVSVGTAGSERQITNVAAGQLSATSTDAINGSQLYATNQALASATTAAANAVQYDNPGKTSVTLGGVGAAAPVALTNVKAGALNATSTDAINGSQLYATNQNVATNTTNIATNTTNLANLGNSAAGVLGGNAVYNAATGQLTDSNIGGTGQNTVDAAINAVNQTAGKGWNLSANGVGAQNVAPGATVDVSPGASGNITVSQSGTNLTIDTAPNLKATSVTTGNTVMNNAGVTIGAAGPAQVALTSGGLNNGGNQISNVASGTNPNDAVNLSQLQAAQAAATTHYYSVNDGGTQGGNYNNDGATGKNSLAGGVDALAYGDGAVAMGNGAVAGVSGSPAIASGIAIGAGAQATGDKSIAQGLYAFATADNALAIGTYARATDIYTTALGYNAQATASNAVAVGQSAFATGVQAVAIGTSAEAGLNSVAQGAYAVAAGPQATAIGYNAQASAANDVALGAGSVTSPTTAVSGTTINGTNYSFAGATPAGAVSVGAAGAERQVQNVAAGQLSSTSTDAINGSQLYATNQAVQAATVAAANAVQYDNPGKTSVTLAGPTSTDGGVTGGTTVTNLHQGTLSATSTDAVNGSQLYATNQQVSANTTNIANNTTAINNLNNGKAGAFVSDNSVTAVQPVSSGANAAAGGFGASATGAASTVIGNQASDNGNANATVLGQGASIAAGTAGSNVALGQGSTVNAAAVATPSGVINGTTYTYAGGTPAGVVSVGSAGAERQITNVAAGQVTAASTDAVNGSQLYATNQAVQAATVAAANAVQYDNPGKTSVTLGGVGAAAPVALTNVKAGALNATSTDAINGSQLYATNQNVATNATNIGNVGTGAANALGGGASYNVATGTFTGPNYTIGGNSYSNVGDALAAINGSLMGGGIMYFHASSTLADSVAGGTNSVAIGPTSNAYGNGSIAQGYGAVAGVSGTPATANDIAVGTGAKATGGNSIAQGTGAAASGAGAVALGNNSNAAAANGVALGAGATATNANDVALGAGSVTGATTAVSGTTINGTNYSFAGAAPAGAVSVGSAGAERQVQNVAAGQLSATSTDAVNGSQLYATNQAVQAATTAAANSVQYDNAGKTSVTLGGAGAAAPVALTNVKDGTLSATSTDAVNGSQLYATNQQVSANTVSIQSLLNGSASMYQVSPDVNSVKPSATGTNSSAGGSGAVASGNNSTALGSQAQATAANSVALGNGSVADRPNTVSVGGPNNARQVTNVAAGTAPTDAVNVQQMNTTAMQAQNAAQAYTDKSVAALYGVLDDASQRADAGVASAMAMASLPQPYRPGQSMLSAGLGGFHGQAGFAVGVSTVTDSGSWVLKANVTGNTKGNVGVGVGAGFAW